MHFGDFPPEHRDASKSRIVILPVPFDGTSTWVKGADHGPRAIIEASSHLEFYDLETKQEVFKHGIYTAPQIIADDVESTIESLQQSVSRYLDQGEFVVTVGGEHSISLAPIKAHAEKSEQISVLQLDAHTDLRAEYQGSIYNHACVMARVKEVVPQVVAVGIRSVDISELEQIDQSSTFYARNIVGCTDWHNSALGALSQKVYITLDLDVLDPAIMPSTGTPEPGGLNWYEITSFLKKVFEEKDVIGFDVVELCPAEQNKAPDFVAAKLLYKMLSYKFA